MRQFANPPLRNNDDGQRNLDRAMRRYLAACKALAVIQRLDLPPIQVNMATNQVVSNAGIGASNDGRTLTRSGSVHD